MPSAAIKAILVAATTGSMLAAVPAEAGPSRAELLAGQHSRSGYHQTPARDAHRGFQFHRDRNHKYSHDRNARHERKARRHGGYDREQHYANARRYAANSVRQARRARHFGYYPDHPRWSLNFRRHLEWALGKNAYELEREYRKRARKLRELQRHANYRYGYGY